MKKIITGGLVFACLLSLFACKKPAQTTAPEKQSPAISLEEKGKEAEKELLVASEKGDLEKVKTLLGTSAKRDIQSFEDATVLMWAAREGHTQVVKALLTVGTQVDGRYDGDDTGSTALLWAVTKGHTDIVKLLLAAGADVNIIPNYTDPALISAARHSHKEILQLLLAAGADVNIKDEQGETALTLAQKAGNEEIVKLLKAAGAKE